MANPQTQNGYTRIANEITEALASAKLLGAEYQVILVVLRKTYGFNKKEDRISLTQFERFTGLSRPTVVKSIKTLVARNILVKSALLAYSFNKDYDSWVVNTALLVKRSFTASKHRLTETSKGRLTHKRQPKDIYTKDSSLVNKLTLPVDNPSKIDTGLTPIGNIIKKTYETP